MCDTEGGGGGERENKRQNYLIVSHKVLPITHSLRHITLKFIAFHFMAVNFKFLSQLSYKSTEDVKFNITCTYLSRQIFNVLIVSL